MAWIAYVLAGLILALAAGVLGFRLRAFFRTGGRSACEHCPYSGSCGKSACPAHKRKTVER